MGQTSAAVREVYSHYADQAWRMHNLYRIVDQTGKEVQFRPNWAQQDLLETMWFLNIVLKARQLGFCLDPGTRVLTADLRWIQIADATLGQELVAVDEKTPGGRGASRKMRTATVQGVRWVQEKAYRLTFDDGRSVVCTGGHRWLSRKTNPQMQWRCLDEGSKKRLIVGTQVRWVTEPWGPSGFEDGWFGGMLDGEGSIAKSNVSAGVNVCQRHGPVWDRLLQYGQDRGYRYRIEDDQEERLSKYGKVPVPKMVFGRQDELFRLIGQTRPSRFLPNRFWEGRDLPGKKSGIGWATIVGIEGLGVRDMVDLQTSTKTFIAEGFVSHNSTFIDILALDEVLWNENFHAGIIAHTREDVKVLFRNKIKFPYEHLEDGLRNRFHAEQDSTNELVFKHGSSIRVGLSMRSSTLQLLHVSEHGKICNKYADKAREIRTGALNTVHPGQLVFIESTAEGREGDFFDMTQKARNFAQEKRRLTRMDYRFHFYPWWRHPDYALTDREVEDTPISPELKHYFDTLESKIGRGLTDGQKAWYSKKDDEQKGDMRREYPSTPDEAFEQSVEGAYFAKQMAWLRKNQRMTMVPHDPNYPVHTSWDLGRTDDTAIWFIQERPGPSYGVIDYYENSGESLQFYGDILMRRREENPGWYYGLNYLPFDANTVDQSRADGKNRETILRDMGFRTVLVDKLDSQSEQGESIQSIRDLLPLCFFDRERAEAGIKALDHFQKEWDERNGCWRDKYKHNWASHGAKAFEQFARGHRPARIAGNRQRKKSRGQGNFRRSNWKTA